MNICKKVLLPPQGFDGFDPGDYCGEWSRFNQQFQRSGLTTAKQRPLEIEGGKPDSIATGIYRNRAILESRLLNEEDVKDWCLIDQRNKWNVYPNDEKVSRWYSLLPIVVTTA